MCRTNPMFGRILQNETISRYGIEKTNPLSLAAREKHHLFLLGAFLLGVLGVLAFN
jgi:hypothetical protein